MFPLALLPVGTPIRADTIAFESVIVVLKNDVDVDTATRDFESALGFTAKLRFNSVFKGFAAALTGPQRDRLLRDRQLDFMVPDRNVHAAALVPLAAGETVPLGVRRIGAGSVDHAQQSASTAVAVLDTGIDLGHPDLDVVDGKNCLRHRPASDDNGHGTHVAGVIGGRNNGAGLVGVAPGTRLYAVKVLGATGEGSVSQVICGLDWVSDNAARLTISVANLSLTTQGADDGACGAADRDVLHKAVCSVIAHGVTVVAAAGNGGADLSTRAPAAYHEVLAVAAMSDTDGTFGGSGPMATCSPGDLDDTAATFSDFAQQSDETAHVTHVIAAPGVCIPSTWPGGGYAVASGTSTAAAHASAAAALCRGTTSGPGPCAGLNPAQVIERLLIDAASRPAGEGFAGDPYRPVGSRYYGYLVWAGY
jgi:subtilisin family serine protease